MSERMASITSILVLFLSQGNLSHVKNPICSLGILGIGGNTGRGASGGCSAGGCSAGGCSAGGCTAGGVMFNCLPMFVKNPLICLLNINHKRTIATIKNAVSLVFF